MFSDIYFRLLLEVIDENPTLKSLPKPPFSSEYQGPLGAVTYFGELIEFIYEHVPNSDIGMVFGAHMSPINTCEFSRLITTAATPKESLELLITHYHMLGLKPYPLVYRGNDILSIALTFPYAEVASPLQSRFCSETFFSYCVNSVRQVIDPTLSPRQVYFSYDKPDYADEYIKRFRCPVEFNAPLTLIEFSDHFVDAPLPTATPALHEVYLKKARDSWHQLRRHQSTRYRATTHLMNSAPLGFSSQYLANVMNISTRGLQKRLNSEGTSFSQLTLLVRRELAKVCLIQRGLDMEETAHVLGFQTQSSFRKFFKSQFKDNPKKYLSEHFDLSYL